MKRINKINVSIILFSVAMILMSFIPIERSNQNSIKTQTDLLLPAIDNCIITVGWKTVDVNYRTTGDYYVLYSDNVNTSQMDPNHTMMWGCGYLDLTPGTPDWACNFSNQYFTASGAEGCQSIFIHSNLVPDADHPIVTHTIDYRVQDDHGDASNAGAITLRIHYTPNPDNSEPSSPCPNY